MVVGIVFFSNPSVGLFTMSDTSDDGVDVVLVAASVTSTRRRSRTPVALTPRDMGASAVGNNVNDAIIIDEQEPAFEPAVWSQTIVTMGALNWNLTICLRVETVCPTTSGTPLVWWPMNA